METGEITRLAKECLTIFLKTTSWMSVLWESIKRILWKEVADKERVFKENKKAEKEKSRICRKVSH